MRIHVLSDLHMQSAADIARAPASTAADVVVLAGDICDSPLQTMKWARAHFRQPVVVVAGNHEFFGLGLLAAIREARAASDERVHFLEDDAVVIDGVRFLGSTLWTDFRLHGDDQVRTAMTAARDNMIDFQQISLDDPIGGAMAPRFTAKASAERHARSREFLREMLAEPFDGPTVVVTHHAPHPQSVAAMWENHPVTPSFVSDLSDVILGGAPELWIHGHTHTSFDYMIGDTRVLCNPAGIGRGNSWFHDRLVVEVERHGLHFQTLRAFVAGEIGWPEAARRLRIVDPWPIRRALVGIRPWTMIAERYGVPVEAIAAIYRFIEPAPLIWSEAVSLEWKVRMDAALTIMDELHQIPEEFRDDDERTATP